MNSRKSNIDLEEKLLSLQRSIREGIRIDKDWMGFQRHFKTVHKKFSENLIKEFPQLSAHEIRLCNLIRLNLSSAEIATVLNVSSNTLNSARYRIHKKMCLPKGAKLQNFLLEFE